MSTIYTRFLIKTTLLALSHLYNEYNEVLNIKSQVNLKPDSASLRIFKNEHAFYGLFGP